MNTEMKKAKKQNVSLKGIQNLFFRTQLILIITLALMLGIAGTVINIRYETQKRDNNLQNVAETIARSPILSDMSMAEDDVVLLEYLDTLKESLNEDILKIKFYEKWDGKLPAAMGSDSIITDITGK